MKTILIAENTARQTLRQPILYIIVAAAILIISVSKFFTLFTFGSEEQLNMMREMGLTTITMSGLIFTIFASSLVLTEDIEKKSAISVLCKPIQRYEYILGKFLGIIFIILCVFIILGICLFITISLGETRPIIFPKYYVPMLKSIVLSFFEVILLNAISLAAATRLPLLLNISICFLIFILGNLSEYLFEFICKGVTTDLERITTATWADLFQTYPVVAVAKIFYILLPNLGNFNISGEVAYGISVSGGYVLYTVAYGLIYTIIALLTALVSFENRELM